jgi:diguanylate cyclase (GGDEF)-like protein
MGVTISVYRVLGVIRDFETTGGASLGLVAWELCVDEAEVAPAWDRAQADGLLEPAGTDPANGENLWRLSARGWESLGVHPTADRRRGDAIARLEILDRIGDPALTALTRVASYVTGGSPAAIHVFDDRYQRRIAAVNTALSSAPAHDALCRLVVDEAEAIVCADATKDPRFAHSSFVRGEHPVRFYASVPLRTHDDGTIVGTLCAFDTVPRELGDEQVTLLHDLAEQVISQVEFGRLAIDLGHLATHDPLTGAINRLLLNDRLRQALARRRRHGGDVMIALVDIDNFKRLNDAHGHGAGDAILTAVATRLARGLRAEDTVARLGGDEFAVIVEVAEGGAGASEIVARIEQALAPAIPYAGEMIELTVSVGAALAEPTDDVAAALNRADRAMYARKYPDPLEPS